MTGMIDSLTQSRHAERYRHTVGVAAPTEGPGRLLSTRSRAGWLLVGLGLRLALPSRPAAERITLIGR